MAVRYISTQLVYWAYLLLLAGWLVTRFPRGRVITQTAISCALAAALFTFIGQQEIAETTFASQQGTVQEAGLALLAGIDDADILGVIFPSPHDLLLMSPLLKQRRMSIFAGGRQDWIGRSFKDVFPAGTSLSCSGAIDSLVPVSGGYRAQGWVSQDPPLNEIVLTNAAGTIIGLGDVRSVGHPVNVSHALQAPAERDWGGIRSSR